jgi:hypothetical protein
VKRRVQQRVKVEQILKKGCINERKIERKILEKHWYTVAEQVMSNSKNRNNDTVEQIK